MKKIKLILMATAAFVLSGCNYLDVVPDGVVEIETQFSNQAGVRAALGACYSYMPTLNSVHSTTLTAGDEYGFPEISGFLTGAYTRGHTLTRGFQNAASPVLNYWEGGNGAQNLYEGIRYCNVFLENISNVTGVPQSMVNDWTAQVIVLRAYYHYLLMRCYGPVLIYESSLDLSSTPEQIRSFRTPLEDCFKFVIGEYDRALAMNDFTNNRRQSRTENTLIDKVVTRALKAQAYLLRASKLFNGNNLYENFKDSRGRLMIDAAHYEGGADGVWKKRWEDARDAIDAAVNSAEEAGLGLYEFTGTAPDWDRNNFKSPEEGGSEIIQYCYNLRYMIVEPDVTNNKEVVWVLGSTNQASASYTMQTATQVRTFTMTDAAGNYYNDDGNQDSGFAFGYTGASYAMEEAFYTKNGVPIDEDKTFDYARRTSLVTVTDDPYYRSYMTVGETTVKLHLDREPRYYAWLLVDRGQYRDYDKLIPNVDFRNGGWAGGRVGGTTAHDYIASGIGIKKFVHPSSKNKLLSSVVTYALPIIRMADLYLMKAEAYCMLGEDLQTARDCVDKVRARAGLKGVEESWQNFSTDPGKPSTKEGLMEIIKKERSVELCFEGARYFDVVRWMEADKYFTKPFQGWNYNGSRATEFYRITTYYTTQWSNKNYLWPISVAELNKNPNLVQNPWW